MTTKNKILISFALALLAVALVGGMAMNSTYLALGTFLFAFALMLGPVAGFGMLAGALGVCRPVTRSLYSLAGLLLLGSVASIGMLPWSHAEVPLPMFVAGAAVGILAVLTQARRV
ncbi:hypothetical protein [Corynebacterium striatum]|uniref:hypothetical protein n=1 Tax=Corynebacterium striatum TaxID=43770 RepID=UPI000D76A962|nr:hypothetical protein [Corynebacterium striatum]PXY03546.1 hypothetical protein CKF53_13685 [Corynebacterium striatum]